MSTFCLDVFKFLKSTQPIIKVAFRNGLSAVCSDLEMAHVSFLPFSYSY